MFKSILTIAAILLNLNTVFAHEDGDQTTEPNHSATICSAKQITVCAHLKYLTAIDSSNEGQFIVHVMTVDGSIATDLSANLWMQMGGHGHGSAPLNISATDEINHFNVTNAWFVMPGTWLVRLEFKIGTEVHNIEIPVEVTE